MTYALMYRGPLTSCNYGCGYCPFSKRRETPAQLERDQASLAWFVDWIELQTEHRWRILFTPWGEALVRAWYRDALVRLSHCEHVLSAGVQTNLSCGLDWIEQGRPDRLALWATYHPTEVAREQFVDRVQRLVEIGVAVSVGVVGVPSVLEFLPLFREELPRSVSLWVNAEQPRSRRYTADEIERFTAIDPQFPLTLKRSRSRDRWCPAGETSWTVDGAGDMRRCHFVEEPIGNLYQSDWKEALQPRRCPNAFCDCFLGKSQLEADKLQSVYSVSPLLRIVVPSPGS